MSDSLRDQLLKAGFSKPKAEPAKSRQRKSPHSKRQRPAQKKSAPATPVQHQGTVEQTTKQAEAEQAIAQRKAIKQKIKTLIEATAIKDFKGEVVYRFTLQNRIRELHISDTVQNRLVADELAITRLNGSTFIVPTQTAMEIKTLNPDWAVVVPADASTDHSDDYDAFPVPDDLQW
ncbi:MAG: DUF2058 domain-containing protein [Granulosicoccus sp.]